MSRNGSGAYSLPAGNPVTTGTTISSTWANNTLSDIATALTQSIAYDGQTTPVANLPMGTYAHTGVGNATVRTMYASAAQVEDGTLNYLTSVSGTNTITATAPVGMTGYVAGQVFRFIAAGANTGACTLNLNSIGAKSLVKTDGSALVSGDIASGGAVQVMYDGTNFQLLNDANGATETVTTLTATTKVVTPQIGSSSGSFTIQSANTTAVTVDASQNVGIGTSSPAAPLDVQASSGVSMFRLTATSGTGAVYSRYSNTGGYLYLGRDNSSGTDFGSPYAAGIWSTGAYPMLFGTNGTEKMRIDSSGNVGIGTSSPSYPLDVFGKVRVGSQTSNNLATQFARAGNPIYGAAMYQAGDTGATQKGWRITPTFASSNTDLTFANSTTDQAYGGDLTALTYTERMRIDSSGNVLVGTDTAATSNTNSIWFQPSVGKGLFQHINGTATGTGYLAFIYNNSQIGSITQNGTTATAYNTSSDYRLKENIAPMIGALDTVALLKPVTYTWKIDGTDGQGFIAHELQEVVPDCVTGEKDAVDEEGNPQYQGIDTSFLVATLTAAIQEQQAIITELKSRIETLEAK